MSNYIGSDEFYTMEGRELYRSGFQMPLSNPQVIVEFGSYDGGDGARLKKLYPQARVVSIEADPYRCQMIRELDRDLEIGLEIIECAVSDFDGEIEFYRTLDPNEESGIGSSGSIHKKTDKYKQTYSHLQEIEPFVVASKTLLTLSRELNLGEIDLLHMDVEGAELRVLKGMESLRPKVIFLEKHLGKEMYEGAYDWNEMRSYLLSIGYTLAEESPSDALFTFYPFYRLVEKYQK